MESELIEKLNNELTYLRIKNKELLDLVMFGNGIIMKLNQELGRLKKPEEEIYIKIKDCGRIEFVPGSKCPETCLHIRKDFK